MSIRAKNIESKFISSYIDVKNIIEGKRICRPANFTIFHDSFSTARNDIKPKELYRDDLPPPPKNHKEVSQHRFSAGFKAAEEKEFNTLFDKKKFNSPRKHHRRNLCSNTGSTSI